MKNITNYLLIVIALQSTSRLIAMGTPPPTPPRTPKTPYSPTSSEPLLSPRIAVIRKTSDADQESSNRAHNLAYHELAHPNPMSPLDAQTALDLALVRRSQYGLLQQALSSPEFTTLAMNNGSDANTTSSTNTTSQENPTSN